MNVHDLLEETDFEEAPEGAEDAFAFLAVKAERRLRDSVRQIENDNDSWRDIQDMRYTFVNVLTALAKAQGIESFSEYSLPKGSQNFDGSKYAEFQADLDHWMTQHLCAKTMRARRDSLVAFPKLKEEIRTYLHHIKTLLDKADLSDARRTRLHSKLADFEKDLERDRLNLLAVSRVTIGLISLSSGVLSVADSTTLHKLLSNISVAVGVEKAEQDKTQALTACAPALLEAKPTIRPKSRSTPQSQRGYGRHTENLPADLDDEIPF